MKLYRELAADVRSKEGSAAAYYVLEDTFEKGDMDKTEKAVFAYSEREPQAYWLAKAFILLGDVYVRNGRQFPGAGDLPERRGRLFACRRRDPWTKPRNGSQN